MNCFWFVVLFASVICGDAARILVVFPAPFISHQITFRPLIERLLDIGHEVVVITTDPAFDNDTRPSNLTEIDVHDLSYGLKYKFCDAVSGKNSDVYIQALTYYKILSEIFEEQLKDEKVKELIKDARGFDLVITEACVRPSLIFSHIFKAPTIMASSLGTMDFYTSYFGTSAHPTLYPSLFQQKNLNMTLFEKSYEIFKHYLFKTVISHQENYDNELLRRNFGDDVPNLSELIKNVDLLFMNVYHSWEQNRPVPPNVIYLGGLHLSSRHIKNQVMDKPLKTYLDSSRNGVVYVSFGSNIELSMFPIEITQILLKVLSQLPYDVILKWDKDKLPKDYDNIKIVKWTPQAMLLKHPKIKLFIMQGGLQSTDEAIDAGVPMIVMPLLGDQWYNAEQYRLLNIGLRVYFEELTEKKLLDAIHTVIGDECYRRNVEKLRSVLRDQPQDVLDRAVWWTEYVLRHGGAKHLRAAGAGLTWTQYLEVKLVVISLTIFSVICLMFKKLFSDFLKSYSKYRKLKTL